VPRRTNDIQELITLLTQIIGKDVATPSAMLTSKIPGVLAAGQPGAGALVDCELWFGLGPAVEAKVLGDINATSGIQTQSYTTSVLTTLRKGLTTLATAGYAAGSLVLHPLDWNDVAQAEASSKRRRALELAQAAGGALLD